MSGIPLILHQTWRDDALPPKFARWRQAWLALHPDWEHRFYDDHDIRRIVRDRAPRLVPAFERLPRPIQRIDLFRYLIVHLDGGLYADLDMEPYLPCDRLLAGADCVLGVEFQIGPRYQAMLGYRFPWQIANCIFAAAPGHPFFAELVEGIARYVPDPGTGDDDVEDTTGPRYLTRAAYDLPPHRRGAIRLLPQIVWNAPAPYRRIGPLAARIHARHRASGTWRVATRRARQTLYARIVTRCRLPNPLAVEGPVTL